MKKKTSSHHDGVKLFTLASEVELTAHDAEQKKRALGDARADYRLARKHWKSTRKAYRHARKTARKAAAAYKRAAKKAGLDKKKSPARKPRTRPHDD